MRPALVLLCTVLLFGCSDDEPIDDDDVGDDDDSAVADDDDSADPCAGVDEVTEVIYFAYVIHNEEDDANCIPSSSPHIPDYNGDPAVFDHFAQAMLTFATMLSGHGATLSFQPEWTFIEGVELYWPTFFDEMNALGTVEIVPHGHESCVPYDELYDSLEAIGAGPETILGGMLFDDYSVSQVWFDAHPEFTFWDGPGGTVGHVDDQALPPFAYRAPLPDDVDVPEDLLRHVADSPVIVTPALPPPPQAVDAKPEGRFVTPSWSFYPTRQFLAPPDDTSVPEEWRADPADPTSQSMGEVIGEAEELLVTEILPLVNTGQVQFSTVAEVTALYEQWEVCLDLEDGEALSAYTTDLP